MSKLSNVSKVTKYSNTGTENRAHAHLLLNLSETQILICKLNQLLKLLICGIIYVVPSNFNTAWVYEYIKGREREVGITQKQNSFLKS